MCRPVRAIEENEIASLPLAMTKGFEVYPNPARTHFTIRLQQDEVCLRRDKVRLPQSADRPEIKIFDVTGKPIKEIASATPRNDNIIRVSLDGIKHGVYFVKVGNEVVKEKLVVTK